MEEAEIRKLSPNVLRYPLSIVHYQLPRIKSPSLTDDTSSRGCIMEFDQDTPRAESSQCCGGTSDDAAAATSCCADKTASGQPLKGRGPDRRGEKRVDR